MTRLTPELPPPLQTSAPHQRLSFRPVTRPYTRLAGPGCSGCCVPHQREDVWLKVQQAQYATYLQWNRVSNLETLQSRCRHLTTRPPMP
ncbi:hypothetical protein AVEN_49641-1 [Araneus ventricosus]|uniref:Uncharacterized protein n=1 Tax=Araneus ventricosus TaxID=182803 RepID=A0A4Y2H6W4_ARAVE|nr:hypothetical protein AVEN_49641-1 [Araneus ventricosus]